MHYLTLSRCPLTEFPNMNFCNRMHYYTQSYAVVGFLYYFFSYLFAVRRLFLFVGAWTAHSLNYLSWNIFLTSIIMIITICPDVNNFKSFTYKLTNERVKERICWPRTPCKWMFCGSAADFIAAKTKSISSELVWENKCNSSLHLTRSAPAAIQR